jgi:Uma2 family endonuclease
MIAAREDFPRFTPEEYFAWEEQQQICHEYINGEIFAATECLILQIIIKNSAVKS